MDSDVRNQKHSFWKEHIQRWQESGLSQPGYCETHGLKLTTFLYYRHRLFSSKSESSQSVNFISVQPKPIGSPQSIASLELMLPNGIRLGVSEEVSESLLKMVLSVAGQVPC